MFFSRINSWQNGITIRAAQWGRLHTVLALALVMCISTIAHGQSRQVPGPPQDRPIVIHSAMIHTVSGDVIEHGHIVFKDGRITHVGPGDAPRLEASEVTVYDGTDLHVYPGLFAIDTEVGLQEVSAVPVTIDHTEFGRVVPEVRAAVAVNPDSDLIPVARANGILTAMISPKGGLISGRSALMRLDGWTWEDMAINADAGLIVNWPRTEPIEAWWMEQSEAEQRKEIEEDLKSIERIFDEAAAYIAAKDADSEQATDMRFEGMRAALAGEQPVFGRAAQMGQIESAVAWAKRRDLDIVIVGGIEADEVLPLLLKYDIPVIISGTHRLPLRRHDAYDRIFTLPKRLHEAGIRYAIAPGTEPAHVRNLNHIAATAAAYGLPKTEALRSVTLHAANILGVGDELGSLEPGKAATLIVTSGDPLEITTDTLMAFIDGRRIDLGTRQTQLYDKYREKYRQLGLLEEPRP